MSCTMMLTISLSAEKARIKPLTATLYSKCFGDMRQLISTEEIITSAEKTYFTILGKGISCFALIYTK